MTKRNELSPVIDPAELTAHQLRQAAEKADAAWMAAIKRTYPNERAGDVRYTRKASATPELEALRNEWHTLCAAAHKAAGFHS